MTIRLLSTYGRFKPNTIVTLAGATETALVAAGNATTDLSGGVPFDHQTPPNTRQGYIAYGTDGVALGIVDANGVILQLFNGITVPGAPTSPTITAFAGGVLVSFTAPASVGGTAITGYEVTLSTGQKQLGGTTTVAVNAPGGVAVTATVKAINGAGLSAASAASASATPTTYSEPSKPGAPTGLTLTAGNNAVTAAWGASAANGSPVRDYMVTLSNNRTVAVPGNVLTATIATPNGFPVTATVKAANDQGQSANSAVSNSVTPATAPVATLRQVSTRTLINQVVASSATARSRVGSRTNPVDVTQLVLEYDNWYVEGFVNTAGSYNEINGSGTVTLEGAIEYPIGTFTRATLDGTVGGGNQATAAPGATARLICNVTIPAGGVYRSNFWASSTGNLPYAGLGTTGITVPATTTPTFNAALNDITDIGAGLASLVMAGTGYTGLQNGLAIGWNRIMAVHSGIAVMNLGTSIDHGEAGMQDSAGAEGSAARSLVAANVAYTNMGVRGDSVQNFLTKGTKRAALQQYYTHILFGGPTNDVPLTLIAPDANTIYGYMQQQYAMFPAKKKFQCTVLPRAANDGSNGTGVTRAGNPIRVALNNLIKANSAGLDGYFDLCPPVESAPDAGTWKTGALTTDGTHPLQAGYLTIKNANIITAAALGPA